MTKKKAENKKIKKKKSRVIFPILFLITCFVIGVFIYSNLTKASLCVKNYFNFLNNKEYEKMYEIVSTNMEKEDFINRIKNIYEGIEAKNISVTIGANSTKDAITDFTKVTYTNSMETIAGNVNFVNSCKVKEINGKYKIIWDSSVIYPDLKDDEKIRVTTEESTRGSILDRNDIPIAKDGTVYQVGIVPGKLLDKENSISLISKLLNVDENQIKTSMQASYVTENTFVPIKKISKEEQELKLELLKIKGIMITDVKARVYPYKNSTSITTGYVQDGEGKSGIEYALNNKLKGEDGKEIYIEKDEKKKKTIVKKDVKNGENVKLTIDANTQQEIYEKYQNDEACIIKMNYNTGEILALVSTPSYDANKFSVGISNDEWQNLQNDDKKPMYNKYLATYVPGSSIKPIIGAIGLQTNTFTQSENFGKSTKKWQNDSSWNDLYVTTLETYEGDSNLENALIYSDNIYFAKAALKIGKVALTRELDKFMFNQKLDFIQDIQISTYGKMESDAAIANSGYGQAEMLVNPIHMASMYSMFAKEGNMVKPYLLFENNENDKIKILKQNVIADNVSKTIKEDLKQVVNKGTAKECKIDGKNIYGKTGTAEIKQNQNDKNGSEIGWFNAFDDDGNLIISMCQNVENKGGSHYVVKKTKEIFEKQ